MARQKIKKDVQAHHKRQDLSAFVMPHGFRGRSAISVQLWWIAQATLFRMSPQIMYGWRRFLLRIFGAQIGKKVLIRPTVKITYPWKLKIGDYSWIGDEVTLYTLGEIHIGSHSVISHRSYLCTGMHDATRMTFDISAMPVRIGDEAWLATDVFVGPGVTVGSYSVVGARSVVMKDIPEDVVCVGNPLHRIRSRETHNT